jgi:hypothetical protein
VFRGRGEISGELNKQLFVCGTKASLWLIGQTGGDQVRIERAFVQGDHDGVRGDLYFARQV